MKASNPLWNDKLQGKIRDDWAKEIEEFETMMELRREGKLDEKLFAETRLRRGAYGQRYDNGLRHDGEAQKELTYDAQKNTKGPNTIWDAPGMQRIKIPYGGMNAEQLELMADLAEEYSDGIAHITTRQDFQLHYIEIDDTPALHRRLAAAGITTREACGNSVRNITACPYAGVCADEGFDVTPYAHALTHFLLGHPDVQDFGRKFKPAFSGCWQHACGLTNLHDLGFVAKKRTDGGKEQIGFDMYVGGGLGAVPYQAKLLAEFVPPEEMLPLSQAVARIFARYGEKQIRSRARLKFLLKDWGIEKFREEVFAERKILPHDERWTSFLKDIPQYREAPKQPAGESIEETNDPEYRRWLQTNIRKQKQDGYVTVMVALPLGDITPRQLRDLADIVRKYTNETIRTTVEQNFVIRWVSKSDLSFLYQDLKTAQLAQTEAGHVMDIVACPGTDTCKLGISASRGLAGELRRRLAEKAFNMDEAIKDLHIKISGCFNSCGQHHVADIGFYGVSRKLMGYVVPHFQLVLGGQWENNGGSYGLPIVAIPSKNIPVVLDRITERFLKEREKNEAFKDFVARIGKVQIKTMLDDLIKPPSYETDPSFYTDWGDPREYTTGDVGVGECAGEVISLIDFDLAQAEREVFEAQVLLEAGKAQEAWQRAYWAMLHAAKGLVKTEYLDVAEEPGTIVSEFRKRFYDTEKFFDPFAGGKFAHYLFSAHKQSDRNFDLEGAHHTIEEAQLFIEATHSCNNRLTPQAPLVK